MLNWSLIKSILEPLTDIAVIITAIFVFMQVRKASEQIRSAESMKKVDRALDYSMRWNDPAYVEWRSYAYRFLTDKNKSHAAKEEELKSDLTIRLKVYNTLNILEEMALACRSGGIDETVCQGFFKTTVVEFYRAARGLIEDIQKRDGVGIFKELLWLGERWSK